VREIVDYSRRTCRLINGDDAIELAGYDSWLEATSGMKAKQANTRKLVWALSLLWRKSNTTMTTFMMVHSPPVSLLLFNE